MGGFSAATVGHGWVVCMGGLYVWVDERVVGGRRDTCIFVYCEVKKPKTEAGNKKPIIFFVSFLVLY